MEPFHPYKHLIQQLLIAMDTENVEAEERVVLEFVHDGLTSRILPHPDGQSVMIEVELFPISLAEREINHDRFLLLHQLNGVARLTHGAMIVIADTDWLTISKNAPIRDLDGAALAALLSDLLDRAAVLRLSWEDAGNTAAAREPGSAEKSPKNEPRPALSDFA